MRKSFSFCSSHQTLTSDTLCRIIFYKVWQEKYNSSVKTGRDGETSFYAPAQIGLWQFFDNRYTGFITANIRSSYQRCSIKKAVIENFAICTENHLSRSSRSATLSKILCNFQEHLLWKISTNSFGVFFCSEVCL